MKKSLKLWLSDEELEFLGANKSQRARKQVLSGTFDFAGPIRFTDMIWLIRNSRYEPDKVELRY